jgi:hypothetical protein
VCLGLDVLIHAGTTNVSKHTQPGAYVVGEGSFFNCKLRLLLLLRLRLFQQSIPEQCNDGGKGKMTFAYFEASKVFRVTSKIEIYRAGKYHDSYFRTRENILYSVAGWQGLFQLISSVKGEKVNELR